MAIISALQFSKKLQTLIQSGKVEAKATELIARDENNSLQRAKENELLMGKTSDGDTIGSYFFPDYAEIKYNMNPLANGNVDLIFTGDTVRSLFPIKEGQRKFIFDGLGHWDKLLDQYGTKIQGLNQQTFERIQAKEHAPKLAQFINNQLGI